MSSSKKPKQASHTTPKYYLVGGAVRDQLLGLPVKDRDWVVVGASPEWMRAQGFKPVGTDFPVFIHPETGEEYALARTERKTGRGYQGFTFHCAPEVTLEEDLQRRDLTINAIAQTPEGELIDAVGGYRDLKERRLRHVSAAFIEDPLRVLRVARFYARLQPLGFTIAPETKALMQQIAESGELDALTQERVLQELLGALDSPAPTYFFKALTEVKALSKLLPALAQRLATDAQRRQTFSALTAAVSAGYDTDIRFACLTAGLASTDQLVPFCQALKAPKHLLQLAKLTHILTAFAINVSEKSRTAHAILTLLETTDTFRRPERFAAGLNAMRCQICAINACNSDTLTDPSPWLQKAFEVARQITGKTVLERTEKTGEKPPAGKAMGDAIFAERLAAIDEALLHAGLQSSDSER